MRCYRREVATMAARKRGNGEVHDLTIEILKGIRGELVKLREENVQLREEMHRGFELLSSRIDGVSKRVDGVSRRIDGVSSRMDHLVEFSGERWRDHEERLTRIEKHLKKC